MGTYMYYGICRFFKPYRSYNSCIHPNVILLLNFFLNAEIPLEVKLKNAVVMKLVVKNTSSSYFVKVKIFCHFYFRYILITFKKFLSDKNIIVLHSVIKPRKDELFLYFKPCILLWWYTKSSERILFILWTIEVNG